MKRTVVFTLCCCLFLFFGCRSAQKKAEATQQPTQAPIVVKTEHEERKPENISEDIQGDPFADESRKQYAGLYHTSAEFEDLYMPQKAWLIGDENIVQLISVAGYNEATIFSRTHIERIEQSSFGSFASITAYDKSGKSISILVSPADCSSITEMLR